MAKVAAKKLRYIITYDVNDSNANVAGARRKRLFRAIRKAFPHLRRIQRSVFEGGLTMKQLTQLKKIAKAHIKPDRDTVKIYHQAVNIKPVSYGTQKFFKLNPRRSNRRNLPSGGASYMSNRKNSTFRLTAKDKKVIDAFTDGESARGKHLESDGRKLKLVGFGGGTVAYWAGGGRFDRGRIHFRDLGSRTGQTVERAVRKVTPRNWLA